MVGGAPGEKPKKSYPMKGVTFSTEERRQRVTDYCDAVRIGFSELVRKLLDAHMRAHPAPPRPPADTSVRVIKEPGR